LGKFGIIRTPIPLNFLKVKKINSPSFLKAPPFGSFLETPKKVNNKILPPFLKNPSWPIPKIN